MREVRKMYELRNNSQTSRTNGNVDQFKCRLRNTDTFHETEMAVDKAEIKETPQTRVGGKP